MSNKRNPSKAHVVKPSRPFRRLEQLLKGSDQESKQLIEVEEWTALQGLVEPPYNLMQFLALYESNAIYAACVRQLARDVAGIGWQLELLPDRKEVQEEKDRLIKYLNRLANLRQLFRQLFEDWGTAGYFGIEVIRDSAEEIIKLCRVPAYTLRVHKDRTKYCQIRREKRAWFTAFDPNSETRQNISVATGRAGEYSLQDRANELIYYMNPYQKSDYYGIPNIVSALGEVIECISSRDYNIAFFENYGIPASLIMMRGNWDPTTVSTIKRFLSTEVKGAENAFRSLIVEQTSDEDNLEIKPLDVGTVREGHYTNSEKLWREAIMAAYSMPPQRIGLQVTGALGGNLAEEATKIYISGVVDPLQEDLEDIVNNLLPKDCHYKFKLKDIDIRNIDALTVRLINQIRCGLLTPNEARAELGKPSYPEGDKFYIDPGLVEVGGPEQPEVREFERHNHGRKADQTS